VFEEKTQGRERGLSRTGGRLAREKLRRKVTSFQKGTLCGGEGGKPAGRRGKKAGRRLGGEKVQRHVAAGGEKKKGRRGERRLYIVLEKRTQESQAADPLAWLRNGEGILGRAAFLEGGMEKGAAGALCYRGGKKWFV